MRKHKKLLGILAACVMSAVMACTALAPCASAAEVQDPAEIERYNLASEDWDELLGVNPPAEEETPVEEEPAEETASEENAVADWASGLKSSDGGMSKLLIIAIIAFALGGIGVAFFIYSQFIYKAKLKRKLAAKLAEEEAAAKNDFNMDGPVQLDFTDHRKEEPKQEQRPAMPAEKTHTQKVNDFFAEFERETRGVSKPVDPFANRAKKPADQNALSKDDEKKLDSVNWDDFFNKH